MDSGTGIVSCPSTIVHVGGASDTMNLWNNLVNIYDKLSSSLKTFLQAYVERGSSVCGLLTAGRRNRMTKINASLFKSEQKSIGEHRHQCLCVNFGTLTSMEMDCK